MARARPPEPAPEPPRGFLASAVRLPTASRNMAGRAESWQGQAWNYWETIGELRYVATWIGNVMSRARLVPAKREGRRLVPVDSGPAMEAMDALYGGPQGQAEMLQAIGVNLTVAGEAYIVNVASTDTWYTLAAGKVKQLPKIGLQADLGKEGGPTKLGGDDLVIRLWTPNPRDPTRADSPVRANMSTLAQITAYDAHIAAQLRSRLAGAGVLFLSSEVEFPAAPGADPNASSAENFMALLAEAMMTPIENPSDPSALVPIVAMVPTESLGKNEHLKFWSELDDAVVEMRDAAIKRFALGVDVPPEVLLGVADANHWNAWLSEESAIKAHLEPRLSVVDYAFTEQYLRPAIADQLPDSDDYFVIADTSAIRLRPNRSQEAIELYDRGELSGEALRRETGFQPEDAPADEALVGWLLRRISTGSTSPDQTAAALAALGVDLGINTGKQQLPPDQMRTDTDANLVKRGPPAEIPKKTQSGPQPTETGLAAACDVLVFRALERAGNRLRNVHPRTDTRHTPAVALYQRLVGDPDSLLAGAWDCAPTVLSPYTDDPAGVIETLDFYVRGLLASKRPHSETVMRALVASRPIVALPVGS